ncbi:MAG: HupE/UreJ family protein [Proteobacteria bacterium]|nr:HupE/UreJ family protein [Pseudomonadota bacterium]
MIRALFVLLLVLGVAPPQLARAHALDPGFLDLRALGQDRWRVTWRVPDVNGARMPIEALLPSSCTERPQIAPRFDGRAWTNAWIVTCPKGVAGGVIKIEGLENTSTDVLVRYESAPGRAHVHRLTGSEPAFTVPADSGVAEILISYTGLGVTHILGGVDHLLFVFALLLLVPERRRLIWAITAFTIAHSITLAAASLGWVHIPPPPVEAVIALSIVFLAYELTLPPERRDPLTLRSPWLVSFAFGLIHGLGFAGALREIGLPEGDIPLALFSFNLGVEIGQLLFIAAVLLIAATVRTLYPEVRQHAALLTKTASYAIGSIAAFWVIERVAAF